MIDCGYRNERSNLVILFCYGVENFQLERVVFPFELLTFQAPLGSTVMVFGTSAGEPQLIDSCDVDSLSIDHRLQDLHPQMSSSMEALRNDLRQRYSDHPTAENRMRLSQLEQSLHQHLPGASA